MRLQYAMRFQYAKGPKNSLRWFANARRGERARSDFRILGCLAIALFASGALVDARNCRGGEMSVASATLEDLRDGSPRIAPVEGRFVAEAFTYAVESSGPTAAQLEVSARYDSASDSISLFFNVHGSSQVLVSGQRYVANISFAARTESATDVIRTVTLDLAGAAVGTSGAGTVRIDQEFSDSSGQLLGAGSVSIGAAGNNGLLQTPLTPTSRQTDVRLRVAVDAGSNSGSAVLTDWTLRFGIGAIPEPSSAGLLVSAASIACGARRGQRKLRRFVD